MCEALGKITGCVDALSKLANLNLLPTLIIPYSSIKGSSLYTELVLSIAFVLLPLFSLISEFCLAVDFSTLISVWNAFLCSCFIISLSASSTSATFTGIYFFCYLWYRHHSLPWNFFGAWGIQQLPSLLWTNQKNILLFLICSVAAVHLQHGIQLSSPQDHFHLWHCTVNDKYLNSL